MVRDDTDILYLLGDSCTVNGQDISLTSSDLLIDKYGLVDNTDKPIIEEHNYARMSSVSSHLSVFKDAVIPYIAGFTVKMVEKRIKCTDCCQVYYIQINITFISNI